MEFGQLNNLAISVEKQGPSDVRKAIFPIFSTERPMNELKLKIEKLPKIELHVHVEGATKPETFFAIANRNKTKLPTDNLNEWKSFFTFKDFNHFIEVYATAVSTLETIDDYAYIIENFYKHQLEQNIIYTEAFLSASFIVERFDDKIAIEKIKRAIQEGERKYGVKINFIPDIARENPSSQNKVVDFVINGFQEGIFIGMGIGGMEVGFPPSLFVETFKKAQQSGLRTVAHAGEIVGPESIRGAVKDLNVDRIGHGITCLTDNNLVDYLRDNKVPMEISPWSNYRTGAVKPDSMHPIRSMIEKGLCCTVNSDDPSMFSTSLTNEYLLLASQGFSWSEILQLNRNAVKAAFINKSEQNRLENLLINFEHYEE